MRKLQITPPKPVRTALQILQDAGYEAYIVGGCVRDALRGAEPNDWDCTTNAKPDAICRCFRDYHVIETGLQHGTVTVVIDHMPIEITTYRIDGVYADHRRPDTVTFTDSLTDDLARRDFTINAMAYHPREGLIDPFHGEADLQKKRIACVGIPQNRFDEDGLRILRGMRFAAVLNFEIDEATAEAIHRQKGLLKHISAERIDVELTKLLCGVGVERVLQDYADVLFEILPELQPMYQFDQRNPHHDYDVYTHTLKTIAACPKEPILRWAALLHDSGKPHTFTEDERGGHFYGHAKISAEIAARALKAMKCDRKRYVTVMTLVQKHDVVMNGTEKQIKRIVRQIGEAETELLLLLHKADVTAQAEHHREQRIAESEQFLEILQTLREQNACMSIKKLAVNGDDMKAIGVPQGQQIGILLNALLDAVMDGTLPNQREQLLAAAEKMC
ncbi:MAG: HD domain-containing protein [Oscillospiraceae bacterium]|nr:HD domain-containing protein [Oscillospiraceae bacterium]